MCACSGVCPCFYSSSDRISNEKPSGELTAEEMLSISVCEKLRDTFSVCVCVCLSVSVCACNSTHFLLDQTAPECVFVRNRMCTFLW